MIRTWIASRLLDNGHTRWARTLCEQALKAKPDDVPTLQLLLQILNQQGDAQPAIEVLRRLHAAEPENVALLYQRAALARSHGHFDEARDAYRKALKLEPGRSDVHYNLAMITRYVRHDDEVTEMERLHRRAPAGSEPRRQMAFALGKAFDDLGEYDRAFRYLYEGNDIAYRASGHDVARDIAWFDAIHSTFDAGFVKRHANIGNPSATPIFVTGLPRSGTSLIEQVLASHPDVYGGGELPFLDRIVGQIAVAAGGPYPTGFGELDDKTLRSIADRYLSETEKLADGKQRITDKSISGFLYLGLIGVTMPNAVIVNCLRDPRDQGLSLFQKDMRSQVWGYSLDSIRAVQGLYGDLLEHWERLFPGRILNIRYEDFVANPEPTIRQLLNHCGLEFDDACLSFHQTERSLLNASNTQVRQPVYKHSIGRWKHYEKYLGPLLEPDRDART